MALQTDREKPAPAKRTRMPKPAADVQAKAPSPLIDPSKIKGARKAHLPAFVEPSFATLMSSPPGSEQWVHEIKFDGYRLQGRIQPGRTKLLTRSGLDWTKKFGKPVVAALEALPVGNAIVDGELVVETSSGASDFSALQADLGEGRWDRVVLYLFDLLYLDGYDLTGAPLIERKRTLQQLIGARPGKVRYSEHFEEPGAIILRHACQLGLEGIVSKRRDAPYRSGRSKSWIKSKCTSRQEFVIAGYVPSTTSRKAIGSLVLGVYDADELVHVGRVGTGFTAVVAEDIYQRLDRLRIQTSPFVKRLAAADARGVRYVRPQLVAEVEVRAWTAEGLLRQASFKGLREDKPAREVVRETAKEAAPVGPELPSHSVRITHADRLYWPEDGVTKAGLVGYYTEVWRYMEPYVVGRALALVRCPTGINGEHFFQKHAWKGIDRNILQVDEPQDDEPVIAIRDLNGLIALAQSGVLEIHPWGSTVKDWERPDTIIMDLDPGDEVAWEDVISAAREVRDRLAEKGLASFVKTSGGKGLHVVAPVKPKAGWDEVKAFPKAIADAMASDTPARFVSTITKSKRRGKILIDYLRNQRGATAVAAYSTRARPGAAVSAPMSWDELNPAVGPAYYTVENTPTRLAALQSDPWEGFRAAAAPIDAAKPARRKKA